ncbi:MAG TPA: nucleotidyltransferase family protein [Armatimonadota bacterium]|nr:nucleotidyltransferase family protein [Armatimonadota bacterium]
MHTIPHRALILAAGRGVRLMPLTAACPKPMVPVGGMPILERILRGLRVAGIDDAVVVHGYHGAAIERYFGDGARVGMRLHYRAQPTLGGTADAMRLTRDLFDDEPFLMQWGDLLVDPANYPAIIERFITDPADPAVVLGVNWVEDPYAGGAVYRDGDRVLRLAEKLPPGTAGTHWNIAGLMVFTPAIWDYIDRTPRPETGEFYVTYTMEYMLRHGEPITAFPLIGERMHFTSPADIAAAAHDPRLRAWEVELVV